MSSIGPSDDIFGLSQRDLRIVMLSILYALEMLGYVVEVESVARGVMQGFDVKFDLSDDLLERLKDIVANKDKIEQEILPLLANWRLDRVGCLTKLILLLAVWELKSKKIDVAIVINEAIELAKCFAEKDAYKFVNGVLDEWVLQNKNLFVE